MHDLVPMPKNTFCFQEQSLPQGTTDTEAGYADYADEGSGDLDEFDEPTGKCAEYWL
jgi:hypothetical protein